MEPPPTTPEPQAPIDQAGAETNQSGDPEHSKGPGRPAAFTDEKRAHFCSLIRMGCRRGAAAAMVGLSRHTVRREINRDIEFAQRIQQAEFEAASRYIRQIDSAANTQWRAAAWIIEQSEKPAPRALTVRNLVRSREFQAAIQRVIADLDATVPSNRRTPQQVK